MVQVRKPIKKPRPPEPPELPPAAKVQPEPTPAPKPRTRGHHPDRIDEIDGWIFRRCHCGPSLAMTPAGEVWWLRMASAPKLIDGWRDLCFALSRDCWESGAGQRASS